MKVLCVGDSLGLPRNGCEYEGTWVYMLKQANPNDVFISRFERLLLSKNLLNSDKSAHGDFSYYYMPDVVVMQLGICDCAPRYYNREKMLWRIIERIGVKLLSESLYWSIIKKVRKRNVKSAYVSIEEFRQNIDLYINYLINTISVKKVIIIKIATPSEIVLKASPNILQQIIKYNGVYDNIQAEYKDKVIIVNPLNTGDADLYVDGYHTNEKGGRQVFLAVNYQLGNIRNYL